MKRMSRIVVPTPGPMKDTPHPKKSIEAVPLYTKANKATFEYFRDNSDVADKLTGTAVDLILLDSVKSGDAQAFYDYFEKTDRNRFPGLERSDLPCLWIEDSAGHDKVRIDQVDDPGDIINILADEAKKAKSAQDLADRIRRKRSKMREGFTMTSSQERLVAVLFGAAFLIALLVLAIAFPQPTAFQYLVFRVVLAVAAAGFVSMTPGFLNITLSNWLKAGGALAVFVVVYFFSPAALVANP